MKWSKKSRIPQDSRCLPWCGEHWYCGTLHIFALQTWELFSEYGRLLRSGHPCHPSNEEESLRRIICTPCLGFGWMFFAKGIIQQYSISFISGKTSKSGDLTPGIFAWRAQKWRSAKHSASASGCEWSQPSRSHWAPTGPGAEAELPWQMRSSHFHREKACSAGLEHEPESRSWMLCAKRMAYALRHVTHKNHCTILGRTPCTNANFARWNHSSKDAWQSCSGGNC